MAIIYLLLCPITGEVRYVGKTSCDLQRRLSQHIAESKRLNLGHRGSWIRSLTAAGMKPIILEDVHSLDDDWQKVERERIAYYRERGCRLVNGTEGGDGLFNPTPEVLARMSMRAIERASTPEGKLHLQECGRKVGYKNRGKKKPPHVGRAVSASNKTRVVTEVTRAKMSATRKGRTYSQEHRQKIREGKLRYEASRRMEI